jgi:hypothetical protein
MLGDVQPELLLGAEIVEEAALRDADLLNDRFVEAVSYPLQRIHGERLR